MSRDEDLFEDSDAALDAEIARRTQELVAESAAMVTSDEALGLAGGLGIEALSGPELDELVAARAGEVEAKSPAVKAALAAEVKASAAFEELLGDEDAGSLEALIGGSEDDFAELLRKRPGVGGGW